MLQRDGPLALPFEKRLEPCLRYDMPFSTVYVMSRYGIGTRLSESGHRLPIEKVRKDRAVVDSLDPRDAPIARPYVGGAPSIRMVAHYDDYNEDFPLDLREEGKGLILHLDHEYGHPPDSEKHEALVPGISRYERERFLDEYCSLFGPLDHFVRTTARNKRLSASACLDRTDEQESECNKTSRLRRSMLCNGELF